MLNNCCKPLTLEKTFVSSLYLGTLNIEIVPQYIAINPLFKIHTSSFNIRLRRLYKIILLHTGTPLCHGCALALLKKRLCLY